MAITNDGYGIFGQRLDPNGIDAALVDVDLGILGASPDTFEAYDRAIRREYEWMPEDRYRAGRAAVLKSFLDRDAIYHTPEIRTELERKARQNLKRKLDELT